MVIGQHGHSLSGGQRQHLAIARAVVANTSVLVLGELTASLDDHSADRLLGPLRRLAAGRTTILITHDQRLTAHADRVLTLDPVTHMRNARCNELRTKTDVP